VQEREPVGVFVGSERGFMHQRTQGEVRYEQTIEFLPNRIRRFAAEDDAGAAQMPPEFIKRGFDGLHS
jgi:hypothetical protein